MAEGRMSVSRTDRLIGLAMKAGKIISGSDLVETGIRTGKAKLVLLAQDASDNTKKRLRDKCTYYQVPIYLYSDKNALGKMIGKEERSAAAVTDDGFAEAIKKILDSESYNHIGSN